MLLSSKCGDVSSALLIKETPKTWTIKVEGREIKVSKKDKKLQVFEKMSEALAWAGAETSLIDYFISIEAEEAEKKSTAAD